MGLYWRPLHDSLRRMSLFDSLLNGNPKDLYVLQKKIINQLFSMQDIHPSNCLGIVDLAEIDLGGLQILVPQDNF